MALDRFTAKHRAAAEGAEGLVSKLKLGVGRRIMTASATPHIDDIDCDILAELQANARIPYAELGRRVGLSTPAVIERVRRLEEGQVVLGYRALIDPAKVGLPVRARSEEHTSELQSL